MTGRNLAKLALSLWALTMLQGSQCTNPIIGQATADIEGTLQRLAANPDRYMSELSQLEAKLRQDGSGLADQVGAISQNAIHAAGDQVKCTVGFLGGRVQLELQTLLAKLKNQPAPKRTPVVCSVTQLPTSANAMQVDLGRIPQSITFHGYDLQQGGIRAVVVDNYKGEFDATSNLTSSSAFEQTLNTSGNRLGLRCDQAKIVLKFDGATVADTANKESSVPLVWPTCEEPPPAPQPAPQQPLSGFPKDEEHNGGFGGVRENRTFGGTCDPGYQRVACVVAKTGGSGHCEPCESSDQKNGCDPSSSNGWLSNDPTDCRCQVHFAAGGFSRIAGRVTIFEVGIPQPAPQAPPCSCRNNYPPQPATN
jgi:hypothetical protein